MWMQLGCRAFIKGNKESILKRLEDEEEARGTKESGKKSLAKNKTILETGQDSIYLANPSMNELMRTIHSATSMDAFQRVVVAEGKTNQNPSNFHLKGLTNPKPRLPGLTLSLTPRLRHRTVSCDDLGKLKKLESLEGLPLMRVHSEGSLMELVELKDRKEVSFDVPPKVASCAVSVKENSKLPLPEGSGMCYWINLAHLLLVIACLRGVI
ncbi:uncharacterized protein LOC108102434 [Drosophila eugracilis]|uniref:uncharacterized protein LOC108102434 n=1 Tax=Drosophila eugracilis TaxID=29029 RepID=UPI0007E5C19F|nr:uncharacterized protein LOC108102434 [Drosophila eugracilis]